MTAMATASVDSALAQRLRAAAEVLLDTPTRSSMPIGAASAICFICLSTTCIGDPSPARMWLLYAALSTVLPDADDVEEALRKFELSTVDEAMHWLLDVCLSAAVVFGNPLLELQIVRDAVVVEVDFSARYNLHTGIQRVTRALLPRWNRDHDIVPVAWAPGYGMMRTLAADEADRVLRWHGGVGNEVNLSTIVRRHRLVGAGRAVELRRRPGRGSVSQCLRAARRRWPSTPATEWSRSATTAFRWSAPTWSRPPNRIGSFAT